MKTCRPEVVDVKMKTTLCTIFLIVIVMSCGDSKKPTNTISDSDIVGVWGDQSEVYVFFEDGSYSHEFLVRWAGPGSALVLRRERGTYHIAGNTIEFRNDQGGGRIAHFILDKESLRFEFGDVETLDGEATDNLSRRERFTALTGYTDDDITMCFGLVERGFDALSYLAWRGSVISRNSTIQHALPCSTNIVVAGHYILGDEPCDIFRYLRLVGESDQFIAGWIDVYDRRSGNTVQPTQIDSVENFTSATREEYRQENCVDIFTEN